MAPDTVCFFAKYTLGVCIFFNICSYIEEWIKHYADQMLKFGWTMTFVDLALFTVLAGFERVYLKKEKLFARKASMRWHIMVAVAMILSRGLANISIDYLNYPTQVIFKSLKLIAVIFGSIVILGKRFIFKEYVAASLMVIAAIMFVLGDAAVVPEFNLTGIALIIGSLAGDSLHSNTQELVIGQMGATMGELLLFTNAWAAALVFLLTVISSEFTPACKYMFHHDVVFPLLFLRVLATFGGALCFLKLLKRFGAVVASMVTTGRKILTVIQSFILFPKPWTNNYLYAGLIFCYGIWLHMKAQDSKKRVQPKMKSDSQTKDTHEQGKPIIYNSNVV